MTAEKETPKRIIKTGYNDRLYGLGVSQGSLAGYKSDPYTWGGLPTVTGGTILPRRDDILIEEGGGGPRSIEVYTRLFNDSAVISGWEKLVGEITQRKWEVFPASDSDKDEEVAEFIRQAIYHIGTNTKQSRGRDMLVSSNSGFDSCVKGLCESLILGISIGEICWMRQGNYIVPSEVKIRDPRRFQFLLNEDGTISPTLVTIQSPVEGLSLPMRSMIIHRHWAYHNLMDPYGCGLGRQLYTLVEFRRTLMSFWLQYADKHTTPTALGKFPLGTPEEDVISLFNALQRIGQETAIVFPDEIDVSWLEGGAGRPELYENMISYVDKQISFLINGESTVGQDTGSVGSYARDNVADSVRMRKAKAFSQQIDNTLNSTLVRWLVELNYPGYSLPRLKRNFEDLEQKEDPVKVVQILSQLQGLNYKVTDLDWLRDKLEIPSLEEFEPPAVDEGAPEMGESDKDVVGERAIGKSIRSVSMENLDFTEFDESGDLKDASVRDKVAKTIAERFNQGGMDEVGWERLSLGISSTDSETSRILVDEYVSPGDIIYITKRLIDEITMLEGQKYLEYWDLANRYKMDIHSYEIMALRRDNFTPEDIKKLLNIYTLTYRLNRTALHNECVVLDPESVGYWSYFAPYYM